MLTPDIWQAALTLLLKHQETGCGRLKEQLNLVLAQIELQEPIGPELRSLLNRSL